MTEDIPGPDTYYESHLRNSGRLMLIFDPPNHQDPARVFFEVLSSIPSFGWTLYDRGRDIILLLMIDSQCYRLVVF